MKHLSCDSNNRQMSMLQIVASIDTFTTKRTRVKGFFSVVRIIWGGEGAFPVYMYIFFFFLL